MASKLRVGGGQVEVRPPLGSSGLVVLQPGLTEAGGRPVLHEAGVMDAEIGEPLCLHAVGFETGPVAGEDVPLLALDAAPDDRALVDGERLQFAAAPGADLLAEIAHVRHPGGDVECHRDVHGGECPRLRRFRAHRDPAVMARRAGEPAHFRVSERGEKDGQRREPSQSQGSSAR